MKLSHIIENDIPSGPEITKRVTDYLQSRKHLKAVPAAPVRNPGNNEWHREQDRSEQRRRDELSSIEESPDMPEPGDNIRTRKTKMEGKVKKVSGDIVLFQLVDGRMMKTSIGNVIVIEKLADEDDEIMEAGWKNAVAAGAMALGSLGSGGAHAGGVSLDHGQGFQPQDQVTLNQRVQQQQNRQDLSNYSTEYLQKAADPNRFGRFMVSVDNAKAELQDRENGKQQTVAAPTAEKQSSGYSTEYLQKAADPKRFGRFLISVEKAQELLDQMKESFELNEISDTVINKWQKEKLGPQMDAAKARGDTGEEDRVYGKIIKSTKHMGDNFERRAAQKAAKEKEGVNEGEEINNHTDTITVDVPLLIRIMEYAKEDAKTDLDLHNAAEKLIELSQEGRTLTMDDYATMIGDVNEGGMGGINRSAPSNDVSYQDVLDDSTDEWRGDTVKVEDVAQPLTREALRSRQKELQRIQMDPETSRSPLMKKELAKKIAQLRQQAEASNLVDTYESKLSKFLEDEELS